MIPGSSRLGLNRNDNVSLSQAYEGIPHPDSLWPSRWSGHAYVVTVGLKVGIFRDWTEAGLYVTGIPSNIHKEYNTFDEAFEVYKQRYEERAIKIVFNGAPARPADGLHLQSISPANFPPMLPTNPFIPRPEDLTPPAWGVMSGPFYVVTVGRGVGIYEDWDTANKQTTGISGCPKKFKIWEDAQNYYRVEYEQGRVLVKLRK